MTLALTGLSHHTSPLALRERMTLNPGRVPEALALLHAALGPDSGIALLSTCNRIELYACCKESAQETHNILVKFLGTLYHLSESEFSGFLYHKEASEAVTHLFRVASSLDSMVVGENEILGQIQQAYDLARSSGTLNRMLSVLLQRALKCGKRVRSETHIGEGKVSVASVAVDLAESILKELQGKSAMIVGSGQVSEQALKTLIERGIGHVMVLNRTLERARLLSRKYRGEAIMLDALPCHLHRADIVISSTGAPEVILKTSDFERAIEQRGRAPMFVIDIAVPRDIEREAALVDNVYCYDMDDLQTVAERNLQKRQEEIDVCMEIIEHETASFINWRRRLQADPLIKALNYSFDNVRERELRRAFDKLPHLTDGERQVVESLARRISNNLLRKPVAALKNASSSEQDQFMLFIKHIFDLSDTESL